MVLQTPNYRIPMTQDNNRISRRIPSEGPVSMIEQNQRSQARTTQRSLKVILYGLKDCTPHCVTLQCPQWDFSFLFIFFSFLLNFILFYPGSSRVARVEGRWEGMGRWMGLRCMMWNPQRINKKFNWKKIKADSLLLNFQSNGRKVSRIHNHAGQVTWLDEEPRLMTDSDIMVSKGQTRCWFFKHTKKTCLGTYSCLWAAQGHSMRVC